MRDIQAIEKSALSNADGIFNYMIDGIRFVTPTINSFHTVDLSRHDCPCVFRFVCFFCFVFVHIVNRLYDFTLFFVEFFSLCFVNFHLNQYSQLNIVQIVEIYLYTVCALTIMRWTNAYGDWTFPTWKNKKKKKKISLFPLCSFRFVLIFILIHYDCYYIIVLYAAARLFIWFFESACWSALPVCIINNRCLCRIFVFRFSPFVFLFIWFFSVFFSFSLLTLCILFVC